MDSSAGISHVSRISVTDLQKRWSTKTELASSLQLDLIANGKLRVQYFGCLTEWRPIVPVESGALRVTNCGLYGPLWLTLRPQLAFQLLSGTGLTLELQEGFGKTIADIVESSDVPVPAPGGYYRVILEHKSIRDPAKLFIPTDDVAECERSFSGDVAPNNVKSSSRATDGQSAGPELRGNNLQVQINILEATIRVLAEAVDAGDAIKLLHSTGSHKGNLNFNAIANDIYEQRERFRYLKESKSDHKLPSGASLKSIADKIGKAWDQDLSAHFGDRAPR
jgi:hypothetical protein